MIYDVIIPILRGDLQLSSTISTFNSVASVFGDLAPEKAELPYIVVRCLDAKPTREDRAIVSGLMYVDYYMVGTSFTKCDTARNRIEILLDNKIFDNSLLSDIRVMLDTEGDIPDPDPRVKHYNMVFTFRACRKSWMLNR